MLSTSAFTQQRYQSATVAFYDVENLFDTIVSAAYIDGTRSPDDPMYYRSIPKSEIDKYDTVYFRGHYTYEDIEGKKIIRPLIIQKDEYSSISIKICNTNRYM